MLVVSAAATAAYMANGWRFADALYMVVLTVYTVGYEEVIPINTPELRGITIALIVTGCTGMIFLTGALIQLITASQLQQLFGFRRMQKEIDHLTDLGIGMFREAGEYFLHPRRQSLLVGTE